MANEAKKFQVHGSLVGSPGKSAYEYAKEGGYTGTEEEFANKLSSKPSWNDLENKPFGVGEIEWSFMAYGEYLYGAPPSDGKWVFNVQLLNFTLVDGKTYKVEAVNQMFNMLRLEKVCTGNITTVAGMPLYVFGTTSDPLRIQKLGTGSNWNVTFTYTGIPAAAGGWYINIYEAEETIDTLDEKYIPDTIARISDIPSGGTASSIPDDEMLDFLMEMDIVQPLSDNNGTVYTDTDNKLYVL